MNKLNESIKIIIAEDFPLLLEDLTETIEQEHDMTVVGGALSGKEVIQKVETTEHDLILMDIEMENINAGISAAEEILESNPNDLIIFLTAHETQNMVLSAMGTGAIDYIVKGTEESKVIQHIRDAYKGETVLAEKVQSIVLKEYKRLRHTEESLLFFINHLSTLTKSEKEIVRLLLDNKKVKDIADIRYVEVVTIKSQINGLLKKLGAKRTKEIIKNIKELNLSHLFK